MQVMAVETHTASPREVTRNWCSAGLVRVPNKRLKNSSSELDSIPLNSQKLSPTRKMVCDFYGYGFNRNQSYHGP
jgi:hypothetical protein